ncbi:MAG: nucleotidyltransferase domain-containing protein [Candidatus Asgardarchaeia archaeon]
MSLKNVNEEKAIIKKRIEKLRIKPYFKEKLIKFIDIIFDYVEVEGLLLFGSVARGKGFPLRSDIDIILISSKLPSFGLERTLLRRKVSKVRPRDVQAIWVTPKELEIMYKRRLGFILDALYEGIILFDKNGFLKKMKELLKQELAEGKFMYKDGIWIWKIKKIGVINNI